MSLKIFFLTALLFFCTSVVGFSFQDIERYKAPVVSNKKAEVRLDPLEFIVTGDVMLGRHVEVLMNENGANYPFKKVEEFLRSVPFVLVNLEGPIVVDHVSTPSLSYAFSFASTTAQTLKENNISVVSLANNHALDQKNIGYEQTKEILKNAGIEYFGHSISVGDISVLRKTLRNQKFVFIGLNATWSYDEKVYEDLIKKEALSADFIIVFVHWGEEYKLVSNDEQKKLARMFIDNGAHAVFGHHPHVVQEIEVYKNKAIFYSLGNFIFDQYFSTHVKEGLLVKVVFQDTKVMYELFPTISPRSQPSLMEGITKENFLFSLSKRSSEDVRNTILTGIIELSR